MRFWDKVIPEPNSGCWLWTAALSKPSLGRTEGGYGVYNLGYKTIFAHSLAYSTLVGPIPAGLQLDHLCRTRCCVNPRHLEPVTNKENSRRGISGILNTIRAASQRTCKNGHLWSVFGYVSESGFRRCRECMRTVWAKQPRKPVTPRQPKTSCKNGHLYSTHGFFSGKQMRCRICNNLSKRLSKQRLKKVKQ